MLAKWGISVSKEVMVLGAGMVGTSAALALQARGYDVVLLDRAAPGSATSFGNAGFIQGEAFEPYALPRDIRTLLRIALKRDNGVEWDMAGLWRDAPSLLAYWRNSAPARHRRIGMAHAALIRRALRDHAGWIAASGCEDMIRRNGYRLLFRDPAAFEQKARKAEQLRAEYGTGFDAEDSATLAAAEPALRRPLAGAIHWHDTWTCSDPGALVKAYAQLFARQGGELLKGELRSLEQSGRGWRVSTSTGTIEAEHVVVALGAWSPQALAPLGYRIGMVRKRGYHMHFEYPRKQAVPSGPRLQAPLIDAEMGAVYSLIQGSIRVATGADLSSGEPEPFPRQLKRAYAAVGELLDVGEPLEASAWSGVRPCMPDMLPLVGAAPRHRGLWFNFGHGHQGFTLGPTTGALLAGLMAGEPDDDVLPLAPSRLAEAGI